jgi:hypothetical protein
LVVENIDEEDLVLDVGSSRIHHLNVTASYVWRMIEEAAVVSEIVETYAAAFDIQLTLAARDVDEVIAKFRELGLVEEIAP